MNNNVKLFLGKIHSDEALYTKLVETSKNYTGEKTDEAIWDSVIGPLAEETGFDITLDDYKAYVDDVKASSELSDDELEQVAGGISFCFILGFGSKPETGNGSRVTGQEDGLGACAYVGIGFGAWGSP